MTQKCTIVKKGYHYRVLKKTGSGWTFIGGAFKTYKKAQNYIKNYYITNK